MGLPLHLSIKLGTHLVKMKLRRVEKFPMIVEIEPLFACNLKCVGCGKIQHPASEAQAAHAGGAGGGRRGRGVRGARTPVSIAGGEPLMHPQVHEMVNELVKRRKFVVSVHQRGAAAQAILSSLRRRRTLPGWCTSTGLRQRHDESVSKEGVFDQAVAAIKLAKEAGFQVYTNRYVLQHRLAADRDRRARLPERRNQGRPDGDLTRFRL